MFSIYSFGYPDNMLIQTIQRQRGDSSASQGVPVNTFNPDANTILQQSAIVSRPRRSTTGVRRTGVVARLLNHVSCISHLIFGFSFYHMYILFYSGLIYTRWA